MKEFVMRVLPPGTSCIIGDAIAPDPFSASSSHYSSSWVPFVIDYSIISNLCRR